MDRDSLNRKMHSFVDGLFVQFTFQQLLDMYAIPSEALLGSTLEELKEWMVSIEIDNYFK